MSEPYVVIRRLGLLSLPNSPIPALRVSVIVFRPFWPSFFVKTVFKWLDVPLELITVFYNSVDHPPLFALVASIAAVTSCSTSTIYNFRLLKAEKTQREYRNASIQTIYMTSIIECITISVVALRSLTTS